jgi:hypothetical protein
MSIAWRHGLDWVVIEEKEQDKETASSIYLEFWSTPVR